MFDDERENVADWDGRLLDLGTTRAGIREAEETAEQLADSIAGCLSNVSDLPSWMQLPALGRDTRPLLLLASRAVLASDWLAAERAAAEQRGEAKAVEQLRGRLQRAEAAGGGIYSHDYLAGLRHAVEWIGGGQ